MPNHFFCFDVVFKTFEIENNVPRLLQYKQYDNQDETKRAKKHLKYIGKASILSAYCAAWQGAAYKISKGKLQSEKKKTRW